MLGIPVLTQLEYLLRIIAAVLCGGLIGLEREHRVRSAGLKTHMIVSAGAALMMIVSKYGFWDVLVIENMKLDPSRVAAGIVSAIGFLGAGVIFNQGFKINGVTTAAGLWTTVGIGMTFGAGLYVIGSVATLLILAIQLIFRRNRLQFQNAVVHVYVKAVGTRPSLEILRDELNKMSCATIKTRFSAMEGDEKQLQMEMHATVHHRDYEQRLTGLFDRTDVNIVTLEYEI